MPVEQLSGVTVVIIIAVCVEASILLFIFAKRQITRFALRNKRGPHTHLGQGGPKYLRKEADRNLDYIPYVKHEPPLDIPDNSQYYRAKTTEDYRSLEFNIASLHPNYIRLPGTNVRSFMINCAQGGPLAGINSAKVNRFVDLYLDARHHYGEFEEEKYEVFKELMEEITNEIEANQVKSTWTPVKRRTEGVDNSGFADFNSAFSTKESAAVLVNHRNCSSSTPV